MSEFWLLYLDHQDVGLQTGGPESRYSWVWRELPGDGHTKRGQDRRQFFRNQASEWGEEGSIIGCFRIQVQFHGDCMSMQYQSVVLHSFLLFIEFGGDGSEYLSWRKISFCVFALRLSWWLQPLIILDNTHLEIDCLASEGHYIFVLPNFEACAAVPCTNKRVLHPAS